MRGKRNNVGLADLLAKIVSRTCVSRARRLITKIEDGGDFWLVGLKNIPTDLYYPKRLSCQSTAGSKSFAHRFPPRPLCQVICETMYPDDWHYYEAEGARVTPEDVVLDCGASEGLFSLSVAPRCRRVYAVEPHPAFANALRLTLQYYPNTEVLELALGSEPGTAFLSDQGIASRLDTSGHCVQVARVDDLFDKITYIKADLEGYEMEMLRGARRTIERWSPKISITTYHKPEHAQEITEYLRSINPNYKVRTKGIDAVAGAPVMLHAWVE
ncbi:MAG: FkbM family methyltransferase [Armatimonadota bacterium]